MSPIQSIFHKFERIMTQRLAMSGFKHIILPDDGERDLIFFLAMEEFVAQNVPGDAFFVWRVPPTVIIGRNQDLQAEVNLEYCKEHGVKIVRRKSGGGCVYSDKGNIMVSYVSAKGDTSSVFERYLFAMTQCLRSLGHPCTGQEGQRKCPSSASGQDHSSRYPAL